MQFLMFFKVAWKTAWFLWDRVKRLDALCVARFSDAWWAELRWDIECKALQLAKGNDKGWRKLVAADDQILRGILILCKSERLWEIYSATGITARNKAEEKLFSKLLKTPEVDRP